MNETEFLRFVSRIISCGNEESIALSLKELEDIIVRNGLPMKYTALLEGLIQTKKEAAELGIKKQKQNRGGNEPEYTGVELTMEEIGKAIRDGRERIRQEREFRC